MRLKPLVCLDLSKFTTFDASLGWQGFQVTFQMSFQGEFRLRPISAGWTE